MQGSTMPELTAFLLSSRNNKVISVDILQQKLKMSSEHKDRKLTRDVFENNMRLQGSRFRLHKQVYHSQEQGNRGLEEPWLEHG